MNAPSSLMKSTAETRSLLTGITVPHLITAMSESLPSCPTLIKNRFKKGSFKATPNWTLQGFRVCSSFLPSLLTINKTSVVNGWFAPVPALYSRLTARLFLLKLVLTSHCYVNHLPEWQVPHKQLYWDTLGLLTHLCWTTRGNLKYLNSKNKHSIALSVRILKDSKRIRSVKDPHTQSQMKNIYHIYYLLTTKGKKTSNPSHFVSPSHDGCLDKLQARNSKDFLWTWSRSLTAFCTSHDVLKEQRSFTAIAWSKWNQQKELPLQAIHAELTKLHAVMRTKWQERIIKAGKEH